MDNWRYRWIRDGRIVGFTYYTKGGFWRGYSFVLGMGTGPFFGQWDAEAWVRGLE